ncbi:MAG: hypothetical protein J6T72_00295, partial [Alphaproteobacteria bacterium]|nr:hypothetical protein [Alphaproteobacteria bacterium]
IAKGISVGEILWVTTLTVIVIAPIAVFFYDKKTASFLFAAFFLLWAAVLLADIYLISEIGHQLGWCELADWAIW